MSRRRRTLVRFVPKNKPLEPLHFQCLMNLENKMNPKIVGSPHFSVHNDGRMIGGLVFRNQLTKKIWNDPGQFTVAGKLS